jgi:sulfopyruvate decarboxylase subunit alpha
MHANTIWQILKSEHVTFFSGVPCSLLKSLMSSCLEDPALTYVVAPREDAALGVASGAYLGGRASGILLQNSGLGNIVNGLTSFNLLYQVPVFMIVSWRGFQGKDAPEHLIMGSTMLDFLQLMDIPYLVLEPEIDLEMQVELRALVGTMRQRRQPVALIVKPGVVED